MLTITSNGRITRDVQVRSTRGGESLTVSVAIDCRDRTSDGVRIALVRWRAGGGRRPAPG